MFKIAKQQVFIALMLMAFLAFGAVAAEAKDTHGADRLVKGAAVGAAVGAVTQMVRHRTTGGELLKGAAVGGAVGAAVGAYSDYKQERSARENEKRRADWYQYQATSNQGAYNRRARAYNNAGYYPVAYQGQQARANRAQRYSGRCRR